MRERQLYFDQRDQLLEDNSGSKIVRWLTELGANSIQEADDDQRGFLFAGARSIDDYSQLVARHPRLRDRTEERKPLLRLDSVLDQLAAHKISIPTPKTWRLPLDCHPPADLTFPLFVRAVHSSVKLGGAISRVNNVKELECESAELRRSLGWDSLLLARQWHDFAEAGDGIYGKIPQEVRVWIVEGEPFAWSFHYLAKLKAPKGFPPSSRDLETLRHYSQAIGSVFASRCVVADFAREMSGEWLFVEAGPGSCAGTAHNAVFQAVAGRLGGDNQGWRSDDVGGLFV